MSHNTRLSTDLNQFEDLKTEEFILVRQIRNIERYKKEFEKQQNLQNKEIDSLKPIEFLYDNFHEIINTTIVQDFIEKLENEYQKVKNEVSEIPYEIPEVENQLKNLKEELKELQHELEQYPMNWDFKEDVGKYIEIGRLKERFEENQKIKQKHKFESLLPEISKEIKDIESILTEPALDKADVKVKLQDLIQKHIDNSNALEEYSDYKVIFDIEEKSIELRKNKFLPTGGVGSESNYLFLHLSFFLGLHEYFIEPKTNISTPFVAPFLIIEGLSTPFESEESKFKEALQLLNNFIEYLNLRLSRNFQFIIIDKSKEENIAELKLRYVHLVEDFRNGNALINDEMII